MLCPTKAIRNAGFSAKLKDYTCMANGFHITIAYTLTPKAEPFMHLRMSLLKEAFAKFSLALGAGDARRLG